MQQLHSVQSKSSQTVFSKAVPIYKDFVQQYTTKTVQQYSIQIILINAVAGQIVGNTEARQQYMHYLYYRYVVLSKWQRYSTNIAVEYLTVILCLSKSGGSLTVLVICIVSLDCTVLAMVLAYSSCRVLVSAILLIYFNTLRCFSKRQSIYTILIIKAVKVAALRDVST